MRRIQPSQPSAPMLELLNWVAERPRTIGEIMVAWPTWEDARRNGLVTLAGDDESNAARVSLSPLGRAAYDRRPITVSILDDYFDTLHKLPCFAKLALFDVTIWNDHVEDVDVLAERLQDSEVLVLIREGTKIQARWWRGSPSSGSSASGASTPTSISTPARKRA